MPHSRPLNQLGQLRDVSLAAVTFARNFDFDIEIHAPNLSYTVGLDIAAHEAGDAEGWWGVQLDAKINWAQKEESEEELTPPFDLELQMMAAFSWHGEGLDDSEIEDWLVYNSEHLLWPYLRAYVQQITAASDVPPLTIYTLGVPRSRPESESPTEQHSSTG